MSRTETWVIGSLVTFSVLYFGGHLVHALLWGALSG